MAMTGAGQQGWPESDLQSPVIELRLPKTIAAMRHVYSLWPCVNSLSIVELKGVKHVESQ
jgi:hypothetical protein